MAYAVDLALDQWNEGERRVGRDPSLLDAIEAVVAELRKRLGGPFEVGELADLYGEGTDWALDLAHRFSPGTDAAYVVDAAFAGYARQAADFAGGRRHRVGEAAE